MVKRSAIERVSLNGLTISLQDGSQWFVQMEDALTARQWNPFSHVQVWGLDPNHGPFVMINESTTARGNMANLTNSRPDCLRVKPSAQS
jgi:hypothetical protein